MHFNTEYANKNISQEEIQTLAHKSSNALKMVDTNSYASDMLGWVDPQEHCNTELLSNIESIAKEIREKADIFVVVGIGGSNQGARALIDAIGADTDSPEIIYAALNLSAQEFNRIISNLENKSVYINVIAKNFKTLEPGVTFRLLRQYLLKRYKDEASNRIITTATYGDKALHTISEEQQYRCLPFPKNIGGRFSVFSAVGLLPCAVAGLDIQALVKGATDAYNSYNNGGNIRKYAQEYALVRNTCLRKNLNIEVFAFFEPCLEYVGKWWRQLFGESEGKNGAGIFPAIASYTEDLHSMGQYMQQGKRILLETFIKIKHLSEDVTVHRENEINDAFNYLDNKTLNEINECAFIATLEAHSESGIPCCIIELETLDEYNVATLLYFFLLSCYYSAVILGVEPFDQEGVEDYKEKMFALLGANK